jgi:phosphoglycerate dehydrogenase-like enzyme
VRIALADIARPQMERLRRHLAATDTFVDIPETLATPVAIDVLIASRFAAGDGARMRFRLLQVPGAGTDKIDFAAIPPEAWVCNAFEHEGPIAEYVFAAILDHALGFSALTRRMPELGWAGAYFSRPPHGELAGKTLGLVGLGHIGAAIARRAKAFDLAVMAVTATRRSSAPGVDWIATADRLPELLARSDYVVLACPLSEATRGMISTRELRRMKPTAVLLNVARAEIAVEEDLFEALRSGVIAGAVLDTWYRYPASASDPVEPSRFPFAGLANVRMTPHSAAWTDAVWERRAAVLAANIARLKAGEPLRHIVRAPLAEAARPAYGPREQSR